MPFARLIGAEPAYLTRRKSVTADRAKQVEVQAARQRENTQYLKIRDAAHVRREVVTVSRHGRLRSASAQAAPIKLPPIGGQELAGVVAQLQDQPALAFSTQTNNMSRASAIGLLSGG